MTSFEFNKFFLAVNESNDGKVKELCDKDIALEKGDMFNFYIIIDLIIQNEQINILKILLNQIDFDINKQDRFGISIFMLSVIYNKFDIMMLLLKDADLNLKSSDDGKTPLMKASENGCFEIVKILSENTDINIKDKKGDNALMIAIKENNSDIVKFLYNKVNLSDKNNFLDNALMLAVENCNLDIVKLLHNKVNFNDKNQIGRTALMIAQHEYNYGNKNNKNKYLEILKFLLSYKLHIEMNLPTDISKIVADFYL